MSEKNEILQGFLDAKKLDAIVEDKTEEALPFLRFYLRLGANSSLKKLENNAVEMGLALQAEAPVIMPAYNEGLVKVEFSVGQHPVVNFKDLAAQTGFDNFGNLKGYELPVLLGVSSLGQPLIVDLARFPHLLIAGTTNSGKSVLEHTIIQSLAMHAKKNRVKLVLCDPKFLEFHQYKDINCAYFDRPKVANEPADIEERIEFLTVEMDARLKKLQKAGCRNLAEYRAKYNKGSYIVVVLDEMADLIRTTKKRFESGVDRLAAKARAAGIHLVFATQYPHTDVVTSTIRANFDGRVCLRVVEGTQSRVVLGYNGAEKLRGKGDAFLSGAGFSMERFQTALPELPDNEPKQASRIQAFLTNTIG